MKAILVIDTEADELPNDAFANVYVFGKYYEEQLDDFLAYKKGVPLKPLPKKMTPVVLHQCIEDEYLYQKGWNDCLKEIEDESHTCD